MVEVVGALNDTLEKNLARNKKIDREVAVAISRSGEHYFATEIDSNTKLLYIPAEQAALCLAVQQYDYQVDQVVAMRELPNEEIQVSPLTQMIMTDFYRRTGIRIAYVVVDRDGKELFSCDDISQLATYYQPKPSVLTQVISRPYPSTNQMFIKKDPVDSYDIREMALNGLPRRFTTYNSAHCYGAVAITASKIAYHSGQYSSYEGRTNIHAEVGASIAAIMNEDPNITDIGIISSRHKEVVCDCCGCCRQVLADLSDRFGLDITIHTFASESDKYVKHKLDDYLPSRWSNR